MQCLRCEQENLTSHKFCRECGTPLVRFEGGAQPALSYGDVQRSLAEALEQQTAAADILRVISSSPTDVQPVLDAMAESAARLCASYDASIFLVDGEVLRLVAHHGPLGIRSSLVIPAIRGTVTGRSVLDRETIRVADLQAATDEFPEGSRFAHEFGFRTYASVPLLRDGIALGAIGLRRTEIRPFTDKQIMLLQTFADQAVIAIENVRLFTELQASNHELTTALDKQTATSDILRVISQSQTDAQPVFETIVRNAVRLCGAIQGGVYRFDGELVHAVAHEGFTPQQLEDWRRNFPRPVSAPGTINLAISTRTVVRIDDIEADPSIMSTGTVANLRSRDSRSTLAVPMIRQGDVIGAIALAHRDVAAFSNAHVELLKTFAAQAVIAIENVRLFKELEAANRGLEAASRHKSEFLANMSHELRTPLNAVIGFSEVLLQRMFGDLNTKQDEYLKDIYASGQHLLSLINDILDLSKIEAGRMELVPAPFHLPSALDNAVTLIKERAARHGITLQVDVDARLGEIVGDERKVKQVLLNLLSNAVKFTPEGGRISLKAGRTDGMVEIAVTDTGIGIAPEDQAAIFEEFRQVGTDETRKQEGTGLGLTLAKKFVELHGGRIWVESEPGRGSTFTFTLPVS